MLEIPLGRITIILFSITVSKADPLGKGKLEKGPGNGALGPPSLSLQNTYEVSNWHRLLPRLATIGID